MYNMRACTTDPGVSLLYKDNKMKNGSTLSIQHIGEDAMALICKTTRSHCCYSKRIGEWYYPNGSMVETSGKEGAFYRNRTNNGEVLLHQRYNNLPASTGTYCCEVPDSEDNCGINQTLCINLGKESTVPH